MILSRNSKLHLVQNVVAHSVLHTLRLAQVTPLLHELHWFPICLWMQSRCCYNFWSLACHRASLLVGPLSPRFSANLTQSDRANLFDNYVILWDWRITMLVLWNNINIHTHLCKILKLPDLLQSCEDLVCLPHSPRVGPGW